MAVNKWLSLHNTLVDLLSENIDQTPFTLSSRTIVKGLTANLSESARYKVVYREVQKIKKANAALYERKRVEKSYKETAAIVVNFYKGTEIVGIIADTHEPFCIPEYMAFCERTFSAHGVTRIVHIGDEVDNYYMSFHQKDPNYLDVVGELEKAKNNMSKWFEAFPDVDVTIGNHTALPFRQAAGVGVPNWFLKPYEEAWGAPKGWKWQESLIIDNVKYTHGMGSSGQNGAINRALRSRQSVVMGHLHAWAGVQYHASENDLIFGMNVGWGADHQRYAFAYGKDFVNKPIVGCGIVKYGKEAIFVPMDLGTKYIYS